MQTLIEIDNIINRIELQRKALEKERKALPSGRFSIKNRRGIPTPVLTTVVDKKIHRTSIADKPDLYCKMLRGRVLDKEIRDLSHNLYCLKKLRESYREINIGFDIQNLKNDFSNINEKMIAGAMYTPEQFAWMQAEYNQLAYAPEEKKHSTSHGLKVRSKNEVIISEKLYEHRIVFRYEMLLDFAGGLLAPDFVIKRADGKMFYWEHMGLTNNKDYLDRQLQKIKLYASANIVPWDNLIISFDSIDGGIDIRVIESEIRNKLLV